MKNDTAKVSLKKLGVIPKKGRGQNFLIDPFVLETIFRFGDPRQDETILEIGPGLGALTERLSRNQNLTVIEVEGRFCQALRSKFPNIRVIQGDFCEQDLSTLGSGLVVFGNIPYSRSTDIIFHLIQHHRSVQRAVLLVQREFAERLAAAPGGKDYGALSVAAQLYSDIRLGEVVQGNAFHPPTAVQSQLVRLSFLPAARFEVKDGKWFERVVRASFHQRRKKLANSLLSLGIVSREDIFKALDEAEISGDRRAETVSIAEFSRLSKALAAYATLRASSSISESDLE